jgi:hypothetical protein
MSVLDKNVTIFRSVFEKDAPNYITVLQALERIREGKQSERVTLIREGEKELKTKLPVVLWSGEFETRNDDALTEHSGLIVIDIDHVTKFSTVDEVKNALCLDKHIIAVWVSPSGDGIKALVQILYPERHRDHFRALEHYFDNKYGIVIDTSGKNESRACFESYDPDICIKNAVPFPNLISEEYEQRKTQEIKVEKSTDYQRLNVAATMIRRAPDGEKHNTLLRASILCGGYIAAGKMEEDEVFRVLLREIERRDVESLDSAKKTITDGIEEGKRKPIREIITAEDTETRKLRLEDGDMSFISSDDTDEQWINDFADGKIQLGLTTGHPEIDKYFVYKKDFTIINGHSNIGKTTLGLHLMVNAAIRHDWRWIVYSAESRTASIKMRLMQYSCDKEIKEMNYMIRKRAYDWVKEHFIFINNNKVFSYIDILLYCEKILQYKKVDGIFIDPYNSMRVDMSRTSGVGVHEYHYDAASEFLTFSNTNQVALWLNTHAITEAARRRGEDGLPVAPGAEDSEHGGKWVNRADNFLTFHRKIQHPIPQMRRTMEWHVRKIRETETGGEPTSFDSPIQLEMNNSRTSLRTVRGNLLFPPLGSQVEQKEILLGHDYLNDDYSKIF